MMVNKFLILIILLGSPGLFSQEASKSSELKFSQPEAKDVVGAYYYPWYNTGKWTSHEPQLTPSLGHYLTNDISVVTQHIDWASYYGVDVLFMSWWRPGEVTDVHLKEGFLKSPSVNKIKFAMLLEPVVLLDSLDGKRDVKMDFSFQAMTDGWIGMFEYYRDNFWDHPSYFKIDGKPVVLMYITRQYFNFGPEQIQQLRNKVGDVYLMADEAFLWDQADPATARNGLRAGESVFDSYVSYNAYEAQFIQTGESALSYQTRIAMPYYRTWSRKTVFHPPIMPYYKDFRPGHPPLPGTTDEFHKIIQDIKELPVFKPAGNEVNQIYVVTSWNEWFEGTSIEPSAEVGFQFCEVLRDEFVVQGKYSRSETVTIKKETTSKIQIANTDSWFCGKLNSYVTHVGPGKCENFMDYFTLVDLTNDEVAIKQNISGKYLSVGPDSLVYSTQDYIGTWEIFIPTFNGNQVSLQSKKTNTWLTGAFTPDGLNVKSIQAGSQSWFIFHNNPVPIAKKEFIRSDRLRNNDEIQFYIGKGNSLTIRTFKGDKRRESDLSGRSTFE